MYLIKTPIINDPKINLAIEEFAVRNLDISNDYLFIYSNSPSVIIGKNQNPFEEINLSYINSHNIEMVRRISGGGAVYHELGNLNFCFITESTKDNFNNYTNFLKPIKSFLNNLGVPAKINQRNDIVIEKNKISGNAQFTSRKRMLSHGTLLFDADLKKVSEALNAKVHSIESKSTKSVKSKVTNISDYLNVIPKIEDIKKGLIDYIFNSFSFEGYLEFNQIQWSQINDLCTEKFNSWEWNWGRTPKFKICVEESTLNFKAILEISGGRISEIVHKNSSDEIIKLCLNLLNIRYTKKEIINILDLNNHMFSNEQDQKLVDVIFPF